MFIIIGIDALEKKLVEKFNCHNLKKKYNGLTNIREYSQPRTLVLWSSFLAGKNLETKTMQMADKVVVISQGLKEDIIDRGVPPNKIEMVPNSVDLSNFKPIRKNKELSQQLGLENKTVLGYVGTIRKFEGLQLILRALAKLKNKDIVFLVVGYGEYESQLKQLANNLKIKDQVVFTGKIDPSQIKKYYSVIDICVYPRIKARVCDIVTPLKPLEAMAMEKFVLASDVGGLSEMVIPEVSGDLFRADDVDDLSQKILYYINYPKQKDKIQKSAKGWVRNHRNWKKNGLIYKKIYQNLIKNYSSNGT